LAGDNPTVLEAVSRMLTPEFDIVGTVSNGMSLIAEARRLSPVVMIVDMFMPGLSGIEAARWVKKRHIASSIVLTVYEDPSFVQEIRASGTMGYVLKSSADRDLVPAIYEALEGRFSNLLLCFGSEWVVQIFSRRGTGSPAFPVWQCASQNQIASGATLGAFCEAWDAGQARTKPMAHQNCSPWLPLEGVHTVGDLSKLQVWRLFIFGNIRANARLF
jgi:DNA-binding NarL/FixJ family response regulator